MAYEQHINGILEYQWNTNGILEYYGRLIEYQWNINGILMEYWLIPSGIIKHGKLWRNPPINRGSGKSAASKFQSTKRNQKRTMFRKYVEYSKPKFRTQENQRNSVPKDFHTIVRRISKDIYGNTIKQIQLLNLFRNYCPKVPKRFEPSSHKLVYTPI